MSDDYDDDDNSTFDSEKARFMREAKVERQRERVREYNLKIKAEKELFRQGKRPITREVDIPLMDPEVLKNLSKK